MINPIKRRASAFTRWCTECKDYQDFWNRREYHPKTSQKFKLHLTCSVCGTSYAAVSDEPLYRRVEK